MARQTIPEILAKKEKGEKIVMLTAYDTPMASFIDRAGVDIILVGDSVANVVLGLKSTTEVDMDVMIHHAKAVNRGVTNALLVGDMPYESYQVSAERSLENARRFMDEAGCDAVKIEWFDNCLEIADKIVKAGIPVMGHVGLTPQTADRLGGFKVQGKDAESAGKIIEQAKALESHGCFSIVLECIPDRIAAKITSLLRIPTIGIGAGSDCDGQVLVAHDLLGLFDRFHPKFVKQYADLGKEITTAVNTFRQEVREGVFPDRQHSFSIKEEELNKISPPSDKKGGKIS